MGTRHIVAVVLNDEYKVAQYGQWDGYPEGQGAVIQQFFSHDSEYVNMDRLREAVSNCTFMTDEEYHRIFNSFAKTSDMGMTMDEADKFKASQYGYLSRDTSAEIIPLIYERNGLPLTNSISFAADSLFCEWGYVINLDNDTLEIYKGFNKEPLAESERFADMQPVEWGEDTYFPIKLLMVVPLNELPKLDMAKVQALATEAEKADEGIKLEGPDKVEPVAIEADNDD